MTRLADFSERSLPFSFFVSVGFGSHRVAGNWIPISAWISSSSRCRNRIDRRRLSLERVWVYVFYEGMGKKERGMVAQNNEHLMIWDISMTDQTIQTFPNWRFFFFL
jgi:hypothetical protein